MNINNPRIAYLIRRLLRGRVEFLATASKTWQLAPAEVVTVQPAIFPTGALDRIISYSPWRESSIENLLALGGTRKYPGTRGYELNNVNIVGPYVYSGSAKDQVGLGDEREFLFRGGEPSQSIDCAKLASTWSGTRWFGCLLLDDFPLELIVDDCSFNIAMISKAYEHGAEYRQLLDLGNIPVVTRAHVRKLLYFDDATIGRDKRERYIILRNRLRENLMLESSSLTRNSRVYLKRGDTGDSREIANEDEVECELRKIGFVVVDPSILTAKEIALKTLGAEIVVGIEGSHLSHAIFTMAENATLLVLQPPTRFAMVYKEFTDCIGLRFAFVVGETQEGQQTRIDTQELCALIESRL